MLACAASRALARAFSVTTTSAAAAAAGKRSATAAAAAARPPPRHSGGSRPRAPAGPVDDDDAAGDGGGMPWAQEADPGARLTVAELVRVRPMRMDNILAQQGLCLRREARQFCRGHEIVAALATPPPVRLARVLTGATKVDPTSLTLDGAPLAPQPPPGAHLHLALHKPAGYVCTHALDEGRTVYELLPAEFQLRNPVLATVGRLDKNATGLLLLTTHGGLAARLTSPRRGVPKEYVVSLAEPLSPQLGEVAAFASGRLRLVDGSRARPAVLVPHADPALRHVAKVTLAEGRHHQLRRMFAAVGHAVTGIHRVGFGGLRLPELGLAAPGSWRQLTPAELAALLDGSKAVLPPEAPRAGGARVRLRGGRGDVDDRVGDASDGGDGDDDDVVVEAQEAQPPPPPPVVPRGRAGERVADGAAATVDGDSEGGEVTGAPRRGRSTARARRRQRAAAD
jgi:16S rRNA pseudouridine516 synthase